MHFIISKSEFLQAINKIQNIIPVRPPVPILSNFIIEAIEDQIIITSTDITVTMRFYIAAKVLSQGSAAIPGKKFCSLIRELSSPSIEVSLTEKSQVVVKSGSSSFKFHSMNPKDYPLMSDLSGAIKINIDPAIFKEMVERTSFASARDDTRFAINGILLEIQNGQISLVATDGKRLAKMSAGVSIDPTFSQQHIIPIKAVDEIASIISNEARDLTLYLMDGKVGFECDKGILVTKLLTGDYPDYRRVFPQGNVLQVQIHREELQTLLRQVALFTSETKPCVIFFFANHVLELTANNPELGEGKVSTVVNYEEQPLQIAFSPIYFLDILRHSKEETLTLTLTDPFNPAMITDSTSSQFIIMPMRVS